MQKLQDLQNTKSLSDLAHWLGYKPKALSYILYKIPETQKYETFTIKKKGGGERLIKAPVPELKNLQKRLAKELSHCFEEIIKSKNHSKSLSHGFRKEHSIITNAKNHKNKRYVFNIDLKDFFPSINLGRVRGFFISNTDFALDPKVATVIAQIACHENSLPQGSPTSPVISNLIGHLLDIRMVNLAKKSGCTYTRYADDLTFSTKNKTFPESIAYLDDPENHTWLPSIRLNHKIKRLGFIINDKKTSMQYKSSRQVATGLVVNKKVNIKSEYYKHARSMCHSLFINDNYYLRDSFLKASTTDTQSHNKQNNDVLEDKKIGSINKLHGILNHIYHVKNYEKNNAEKTSQDIDDSKHRPDSITRLYREFLFYKKFFSNNKPIIVTEGSTDVVYLKCAMRSLFNDYEKIIKKENDNFVFEICLLNWSKTFTNVCSFAKGTSGQGHITDQYGKIFEKFKGKGKVHPVILLSDNDSGSKSLFSRIKEKDRTKDFYFIKENLYLVTTPLGKDGSDTLIEDFFEKELLNFELNGKTLELDEKKFNKKKNYSKTAFAESIVGRNYNTINFDGFRKILDRIIAVIDYHSSTITK
jgi:hypothetical protein